MKKFLLFLGIGFIFVFGGDRDVKVWQSPSCGCCEGWVKHMKNNGFKVSQTKTDEIMKVKEKFKIPPKLASCHTALVGGYVVEGHVPASDIEKLLKDKPKNVIGILAPGMPMGSPGMEYGDKEPYEVILLKNDGSTEVFAKH